MILSRLFSLLMLSLTGAVAVANEQTPHAILESAATSIAERLDGNKEQLEGNPDELYALIDEILLPHFDTRYAGYLVLGKHWRSASDDQRTKFIDVFYRFLLRSYARGILEFDQQSIRFLPPRGEQDEKKVVVKTEMSLDDGTAIPVNYSMRNSKDGWRVYDVRIEGVSYIQNYRNQFNAEISAKGIDAVIARLAAETAAKEAAQATSETT